MQLLERVGFNYTYLPQIFRDNFSDNHLELIEKFSLKQRPLVGILPRGGGSTSLLMGEILYRLYSCENEFIVCFFENISFAKQFMRSIKYFIEDLSLSSIIRQSEIELLLENGNSLLCKGWRQGVKKHVNINHRPTLIIGHDMYTKHISTEDNLYDMIFTEWLPALLPREYGGGTLLFLGQKSDIISRVMESPITKSYVYPALSGNYNKYLLYLDKHIDKFGYDMEFLEDTVEMMKEMKSYWPDRYPIKELMKLYVTRGREVFFNEYMHKTWRR